jgi:hypothetical protein
VPGATPDVTGLADDVGVRCNPHHLRHPVPDLPQPFLKTIHDHLRKLRRAVPARDDGGDVVHLLQTGYGH